MMKGLPEIPKSTECSVMDQLIKVVDFLFPYGNYWYYPAYIIMWVGLSLFGLYTSILVVYLDQGKIIQTDTFVAVMPFTTSHMQTELSTAVISLLFNLYGTLMAVFVFYIAIAGIIDVIDLFQTRFYEKEDDEL